MKKIFLLILCAFLAGRTSPSAAEVISITELGQVRPHDKSMTPEETLAPNLPDFSDREATREFFKRRLEETSIVSKDIDLSTPSSVDVVHTPEYYEALEEKNKPLFQKMYEEALNAIKAKDNGDGIEAADSPEQREEYEAAQAATRFFTLARQDEPPAQIEPQIATVSFALPSGRRVLAPAVEHIPYFLSYIDIQANGYLKVEDTIVVVADGQKFAHALQRVFPKYVYDTDNHAQRIELILEHVEVNGTPIDYTAEEIGNDIILKAKYKQKLEPGVYTYTFSYMVNHHLRTHKNSVYMDWNITGRPLNAFITSANAIITLPTGAQFENAQTIISNHGEITNRRSNTYLLAPNVVAFSNFTPLFNGESMSVAAVVDKNVFLPDFDKGFANFISNWGNVLYAAFGLAAIVLSYILSLLTLKKDKKNKYTPSYNGSLIRHLLVGKYDRVALVAQILDLYRKQALDIKADNNRIFLEKNDIGGTRLNKIEKKALKILFAKKAKAIEVNTAHNVVCKKVSKLFAKANEAQIKKFRLKHNISYVLFSTAMVLLTEIFIAVISTNTAQTLTILLATSVLYAFYVWIIRHRFKRWYIALPMKSFSLAAIVAVWVFSGVYIGGITSALILAMIVTVFAFTRLFDEQNNFINEAKTAISSYKEYLTANADAINLGRDFINQQSSIYALNIMEYYPENAANKKFYRLDLADMLRQALIGIL